MLKSLHRNDYIILCEYSSTDINISDRNITYNEIVDTHVNDVLEIGVCQRK